MEDIGWQVTKEEGSGSDEPITDREWLKGVLL
jgi:hypothetical protein